MKHPAEIIYQWYLTTRPRANNNKGDNNNNDSSDGDNNDGDGDSGRENTVIILTAYMMIMMLIDND